MPVPPFGHIAVYPVSPLPVQWFAPAPAATALSGPHVPPWREGTSTRPCTGQPLPPPSPGDACELRGPEMLWFAALPGFGIRHSQPPWPLWWKSCCSPARLCSTLTGTHPHTLPRLLPPAGLPKQHVRSRLVSRAKPRVRVRLVSHADLLCQGSDPVLVRKQTHCNILGSVALSHPLGKPMLWIGRAGLEVLGHSVTIPLAAQTITTADTSALNYTLGLHSPITKVTGMIQPYHWKII